MNLLSSLARMRSYCAAFFLLVLFAGCDLDPNGESPVTADDIVKRHVAAIGGGGAIDALQAVRYQVDIVEPTFSVTGDYRASRDGLMRIDIFAGGQRVFSEGIDAQGPWQQHGTGAEIEAVSDDGRAALERGIDQNIMGLHRYAERGHTMALHGREEVAGVNYYVLRFRMQDGFERYLYFNPDTWLLERRREVSALHPDIDSEKRPAETVHSAFKPVCGILQATEMHKTDLLTGEQIQQTRVVKSACNLAPEALEMSRDINID